MYRKILVIIFLVIFSAYSQNKLNATKNKNEVILINFEGEDILSGWSSKTAAKKIYLWGRSKKLFLIGDMNPFIDKKANFIREYGSKIIFKNLSPGKHYFLWIDFVKYRGNKEELASSLKISGDGQLLDEINFKDIPLDKLFQLPIPKEITFDGKLEISFEDFAVVPGFWGMWDLILTDSNSLDDINFDKIKKVQNKVDLDIQSKLIDAKKNKRKRNKKPHKLKPISPKGDVVGKMKKNSKKDGSNSIIKPEKTSKNIKLKNVPSAVKKRMDDIKRQNFKDTGAGKEIIIKEPHSPTVSPVKDPEVKSP